jgi:transposase
MSVSLVARQHGVAPNQVFTWRRLYAEGALLLYRGRCQVSA